MRELEHLDCFGEETRKKIVEKYDIKLIIYAKLLNGQIKKGDARKRIRDTYYEFQCTLKSNENVIKAITCGSGAGKHLLELAGIDKPAIFNPLRNRNGVISGDCASTNNTSKVNGHDKVAKELYNAINWLISSWNTVPYGKLLDIKEGLEKYPNYEPHMWKIEYVNNIIKKDIKGRTITQMINYFRDKDNNIKEFSFEYLNKKLQDKSIQSYF